MNKIVAVREKDGVLTDYKLDDGRVLNKDEAVKEANAGNIEAVSSFITRDGDMSIRSNRGHYDYSLENLPRF